MPLLPSNGSLRSDPIEDAFRSGPVAEHMERIGRVISSSENAVDMRRRMAAAALDMDTISDGS